MIAIDDSQRRAARVVGLMYLLVLVPAMFAEFYVPGRLIDYGDAAITAKNIVAHERLFRLGIAANLFVFVLDVVLIAATYVVLERIDRPLALLATFFRLLETAFLIVVTLHDLAVLRILSGAVYLQSFEPDRLIGLARLSIAAHADAYNVGLVLFGFGATIFCYLWYKSAYIPRVLAVWGLAASMLVAVSTFSFIIFPEVRKVLTIEVYGGPIFIFELGIGLWLLLKGLRRPA